jgi:hypothetical protein
VVLSSFWKFPVGRLVGEVLQACPCLEELVLQSMDHSWTTKQDSPTTQHLTLPSLNAIPSSSSLTRVRLCEPGDMWVSPMDLINYIFPNPSCALKHSLEYLQLSRRVNANGSNDEIFVDEILEILSGELGRTMKKVVVSLFDAHAGPFSSLADNEDEGDGTQEISYEDTYIEQLLKSAQAVDKRIEIRAGRYWGDWAKEWYGNEAMLRGVGSLDFWKRY